MHINTLKLLPYAYLMGQAAADGFDLGQNPATVTTQPERDVDAADRGDEVDESLFEDEPDAPRGSPEKPKEKEKEKAKPEPEPEPEDDDEDDDEDDEVELDKDKAKEKEPEKPKEKEKKEPSRAEKRITQLNERNQALERQLAAKVGSEETARTLADLETQATHLEKEWTKAMGEDPDKAASLLSQLNKVNRTIARVEAMADAEAAVTEKFENRDLNVVISEITELHPELLKGSDEFDADLTAEVNAVYMGLIPSSVSKAAAMRKAVKYVMGSTVAAKDEPTASKADKVRAERKAEAAAKTAAAVGKQPADLGKTGVNHPNDKGGTIRTLDDLNKASEAEIAKARGDDL